MGKFKIGHLVATNGVADKMGIDDDFRKFVDGSLKRYVTCDWGDMNEEDKKSNDDAVVNGERILAAYVDPNTKIKIWIITEWDRSITTILFPSEY